MHTGLSLSIHELGAVVPIFHFSLDVIWDHNEEILTLLVGHPLMTMPSSGKTGLFYRVFNDALAQKADLNSAKADRRPRGYMQLLPACLIC